MEKPVALHTFRISMRVASALGLSALSATREINPLHLGFAWAAWGASLFLDRRGDWQVHLRRVETPAVLALVALTLLDFFRWGSSLFVTVAHFLLLFQMFKLLGLKERKDAFQILLVSYFQVLSACTLSVDVWQAVILVLLIPVGIAGLFWHEVSRHEEESKASFSREVQVSCKRLITLIGVVSLPIILLLAGGMFMVFPRLGFRSAFGGLGMGKSGYTEQVNLSRGGRLSEDASPVLWLKIIPARDRDQWNGYVRGTTLDHFDGKSWSLSHSFVQETVSADAQGVFQIPRLKRRRPEKSLRQQIILINTSGSTLFGSPFIGEVTAPFATLHYRADGSFRWATGLRKPLQYDVVSYDRWADAAGFVQGLSEPARRAYVALPDVSYARTQELARRLMTGRTLRDQAEQVAAYLRANYVYNLFVDVSQSDNPVEEFLFERKAGSCGYFASAMAVLLRVQGVPARVVAGYYKGVWNNRAEQFLLREKDAHAWVEAYLPGEGWVAFDPTPRVDTTARPQRWLIRLQENWDYANYQWDRLVVQYDLYSQVKIFEDAQSRTSRFQARMNAWADLHLSGKQKDTSSVGSGLWWKALLGFVAVTLSGWIIWGVRYGVGRKAKELNPHAKAYLAFLAKMARRGYPKAPAETGIEYAARLGKANVPSDAEEVTRRYYAGRFSGRKG